MACVYSLVPVFVYPDIVRICIWVLGGIHNACAMCALISFFITNHPTLPRLKPLRSVSRLCGYMWNSLSAIVRFPSDHLATICFHKPKLNLGKHAFSVVKPENELPTISETIATILQKSQHIFFLKLHLHPKSLLFPRSVDDVCMCLFMT